MGGDDFETETEKDELLENLHNLTQAKDELTNERNKLRDERNKLVTDVRTLKLSLAESTRANTSLKEMYQEETNQRIFQETLVDSGVKVVENLTEENEELIEDNDRLIEEKDELTRENMDMLLKLAAQEREAEEAKREALEWRDKYLELQAKVSQRHLYLWKNVDFFHKYREDGTNKLLAAEKAKLAEKVNELKTELYQTQVAKATEALNYRAKIDELEKKNAAYADKYAEVSDKYAAMEANVDEIMIKLRRLEGPSKFFYPLQERDAKRQKQQ